MRGDRGADHQTTGGMCRSAPSQRGGDGWIVGSVHQHEEHPARPPRAVRPRMVCAALHYYAAGPEQHLRIIEHQSDLALDNDPVVHGFGSVHQRVRRIGLHGQRRHVADLRERVLSLFAATHQNVRRFERKVHKANAGTGLRRQQAEWHERWVDAVVDCCRIASGGPHLMEDHPRNCRDLNHSGQRSPRGDDGLAILIVPGDDAVNCGETHEHDSFLIQIGQIAPAHLVKLPHWSLCASPTCLLQSLIPDSQSFAPSCRRTKYSIENNGFLIPRCSMRLQCESRPGTEYESLPHPRRLRWHPTSSSPPSPWPTSPAVRLRFFFCLPLRLCVWVSALDSSLLPIALAAPAPFCDVKLPTRFGSVGLTCGILSYRSKTRSRKLLGLTSLPLTASGRAPREAPEAHSLDSTLLSPRYLTAASLYRTGMTRGSGRGFWSRMIGCPRFGEESCEWQRPFSTART